MAELNQQQVAAGIKVALAAGGPVYAFIIKKFGCAVAGATACITDSDYTMYANLAAYLLPPVIVYGWAWFSNRRSSQVANVATFTPAEQAEALAKTPDTAKVLVAEAVPGVATVVLKNGVGNGLGKIAASEAHPNIVTEAENAKDVQAGTRAAS